MNRLRHILQHRLLLKIFAIIVLIVCLIYTRYYKKVSIYTDETEFIGVISGIKKTENKTTIILNSKEKLLVNFYKEIDDINYGDTIKVFGILNKPSNNTIPKLFNYRNYLYNNDIFYIVTASNIEKLANNTNIIYYIKNKMINHINKISLSSDYLKLFVLGDNQDINQDILNSYRENGLSHLFSISGMHISLFAAILLYFLKRVSYNNYYNYFIIIVFLIIYSLIINTSPSVIRSVIMYIILSINKLFNLKIKNIDIMCLVLIVMLLINPYYIYNTSFEYSYIISFSLILYQNKIKQIKNKLNKSLYISFISFLVSTPICIYNYYQVNILSIILNIIFIPYVSLIIFPLSLISFIIPKLTIILSILIKIMELVTVTISKYKLGIIYFSKPSIYLIILYYLFIYLFLYNKKYPFIFLLMLYQKTQIYFDNTLIYTMLDVGQGDSIFIKFPYNKGNILIDTGGDIVNHYDIVKNKTIPYLRSIGINKIDYLIITHGDYDHIGESINLVNNFKVAKVIFNCGPYNDLEKKLIKVLDKKKIYYYSCIKKLNIANNQFYFLNTKIYDNENDNSNVIYAKINGYKFMFMGDASSITEKEILNKYNLPDIDVLKVGHHGSKTSSSEEFIDEINPKYSIVSVGKNNRYGHPNKEVLENLKDSKIYRTDQDGSIMFKINNNNLQIETCAP